MAIGSRRTPGPVQFARYAFPPNALGYCGPADSRAVLEYAHARISDEGLVELARNFEGAWPYLASIAAANEIADPLDPSVVAAYWIGSPILERVGRSDLIRLVERFRKRAGTGWGSLLESVPAGALPHHSFHVLAVYPWLGLLREGKAGAPLDVMDRCRIRWGGIVDTAGDQAIVLTRPLQWDGSKLSLGAPRTETLTIGARGYSLAKDLAVGDWVSIHWHWVCERLSRSQLRALQHYTQHTLKLVNGLSASGLVKAGY